MALTCPKCGTSGEFVMAEIKGNDRGYEVRRCRNCGYTYKVELDIDDDPYPDDWGMENYPPGGPTCPYCGSTRTQNGGAASDGDGDLYDDFHCSNCGENFPVNKVWIDDAGERFTDEDEYHAWGIFEDDEDD